MKKNNIIKPTGLKGNDVLTRIKDLMGVAPINENTTNYKIELTKNGPDGNVYAIVRENHEYYIKTAPNTGNVLAEDFKYIGGLQNKKEKVYGSYAKAIKQLNLKFISLYESLGIEAPINVFMNDNVIAESEVPVVEEETIDEEKQCGIVRGKGHDKHIMELEADEEDEVVEETEEEDDVELTEDEKAIDEMIKNPEKLEAEPIEESNIPKMSTVIENFDDYISDVAAILKKKV